MLQDTAHKWKGFCVPYGFQELAEHALRMEMAGAEKNAALCSEILRDISAYLGED